MKTVRKLGQLYIENMHVHVVVAVVVVVIAFWPREWYSKNFNDLLSLAVLWVNMGTGSCSA